MTVFIYRLWCLEVQGTRDVVSCEDSFRDGILALQMEKQVPEGFLDEVLAPVMRLRLGSDDMPTTISLKIHISVYSWGGTYEF